MENASNALIMAAGVLIGIMILSLAVYFFANFGMTSAEINKRNVEQQLVQFNDQYASYLNREDLTIYDIRTVASNARQNNVYYIDYTDFETNYKISVSITGMAGRTDLQSKTDIQFDEIVEQDLQQINDVTTALPKYKCIAVNYHDIGRVSKIIFTKI